MNENKPMTKREKIIAAITGFIIICLAAVVIYQYFTIIKVQKQLSSISEMNTTASEDGKIVWMDSDVTVSTPDLNREDNTEETITRSGTYEYVLNKNSKKIHSPECDSAKQTLDKNKETVVWSDEEYFKALDEGYSPCSICKAGR